MKRMVVYTDNGDVTEETKAFEKKLENKLKSYFKDKDLHIEEITYILNMSAGLFLANSTKEFRLKAMMKERDNK